MIAAFAVFLHLVVLCPLLTNRCLCLLPLPRQRLM